MAALDRDGAGGRSPAGEAGSEAAERPLTGLGGGANQAGGRAYNERLVLSLLRLNGPLPKAVLARLTGLSAQTVSLIVRRLEGDGLVLAREPLRGRVGQPSVPYALNPLGALSFGLKIGRRSCDVVLCDFLGRILARDRTVYAYPVPEPVLAFVGEAVARLGAGASRVTGIGVAMPFEIWKWAEEVDAPAGSLDAWRSLDTARAVERLTGLPTYVANDATASCGAELAHGYGGSEVDLLYVFVGSFVGGGVVLNGRLVQGRRGNAGAIGSMPLRMGARTSQLIRHASIVALERALVRAGRDAAILQDVDADWTTLGPLLDDWIATTAQALAHAIVSGVSILDFGHVCIDGAVPRDVLARLVERVAAAIEALDRQGLSPFTLRMGGLGPDARALGGAMLPVQAHYGSGQDVILKQVPGEA
jgi:predicted NBD/HSP70 family sugar kinase